MASLNGLLENSSLTQTEQLVQAYRSTQQYRIDALNTKKSSLESKQVFYNNLNSRINSLKTNIDTMLASTAVDKFKAKQATVSDATFLSATASGTAAMGVNTVTVKRLATNDSLISNKLKLNEDFAFGGASGEQSFDITINGSTKSVSVNLDGVTTNEAAMKKIVEAINNTDDVNVTASLIKDTSTTGRITLTSKDTGADNRILFTDNAALAALGFVTADLNSNGDERVTSTNNSAGYRTAKHENLDSKININGIPVFRGSNTVDDALDGLTLNLLKTHDTDDAAVTITTGIGSKAVEDFVNSFLTSYNDLLRFVSSDKNTLRNDSAINTLFTSLRGLPSTQIVSSEYPDNNLRYLSDVGIKAGKDGTLTIDDKDRFAKALKENPENVAALFTSSDGFANKIDAAILPLVGGDVDNLDGTKRTIDGLIKSRRNNLSSQIDSTVQRKKEVESRIDQQANTLRKQYESMLKIMYEMQGQQNLFIGYDTSGYNSLL